MTLLRSGGVCSVPPGDYLVAAADRVVAGLFEDRQVTLREGMIEVLEYTAPSTVGRVAIVIDAEIEATGLSGAILRVISAEGGESMQVLSGYATGLSVVVAVGSAVRLEQSTGALTERTVTQEVVRSGRLVLRR